MTKTNDNYKKLKGFYLFSEINKRVKKFRETNPNLPIYHLGIGNTTQPLSQVVIAAMHRAVENLASQETYTGYGDEQGNYVLREKIATFYEKYGVSLSTDEIFISDGAKSDLGNILSIFDQKNIIAMQDPVYPAYVDSAVIQGFTGRFRNGLYKKLVYLACTEENNFFPKVPEKHVDVIYLCSPNNPTGSVATRAQLKKFVDYARKNRAIIIFDSAYSAFIQDSSLPKSIYEVPGAKKCAIEISSFSKYAGFTGVRLGWTIVPNDLDLGRTQTGQIRSIWNRRQTTMFNGASNIAQAGGLAVLTPQGQKECLKAIKFYLKNARLIRNCFISLGFFVIGGENAPYVWVKTPKNMPSWEFFGKLLFEAQVVSTPGIGFGPLGEGYVRFSAFGDRKQTMQAIKNIKAKLQL